MKPAWLGSCCTALRHIAAAQVSRVNGFPHLSRASGLLLASPYPRALAGVLGRQHLSMSLKTTNRAAARRLATQVNLILDDVAMLVDGADPHLTRSQIETMLHIVVEKQVAKRDGGALDWPSLIVSVAGSRQPESRFG
jgi:hypothetical protein